MSQEILKQIESTLLHWLNGEITAEEAMYMIAEFMSHRKKESE